MKKAIKIVAPLLVLALFSCQEAKKEEAKEETAVVEAPALTKAEVEAAVNSFNTAMVAVDGAALDSITDGDLTYGHSSGVLQDKAEFLDQVLHGSFKFLDLKALDQSIHIYGNTAIVRHIFDSNATNNGESVHVHIGNVQVYQKQDGVVKLIARQAFKLPEAQ